MDTWTSQSQQEEKEKNLANSERGLPDLVDHKIQWDLTYLDATISLCHFIALPVVFFNCLFIFKVCYNIQNITFPILAIFEGTVQWQEYIHILRDHHHHQPPELFHLAKLKPPHLTIRPTQTPETTILRYVSLNWITLTTQINGIREYLSFCDWLLAHRLSILSFDWCSQCTSIPSFVYNLLFYL